MPCRGQSRPRGRARRRARGRAGSRAGRTGRPRASRGSGLASNPTAADEPFERADQHGELEVGGGDAVGEATSTPARASTGSQSISSACPGSPNHERPSAALGLELEQVAAERLLEPGEGAARRVRRQPAAPRPAPPGVDGSASPRAQRSSSRQNASAAVLEHARAGRSEPPRRVAGSTALAAIACAQPRLTSRRRPAGSSAAAGSGRRRAGRSRRAGAPGSA